MSQESRVKASLKLDIERLDKIIPYLDEKVNNPKAMKFLEIRVTGRSPKTMPPPVYGDIRFAGAGDYTGIYRDVRDLLTKLRENYAKELADLERCP